MTRTHSARFRLSSTALDTGVLRDVLAHPAAGACVTFEGWVRNHNHGREVTALEYEAYEDLAVREGERIVTEACRRFAIEDAACVHRTGRLHIGQIAVWVGVSAAHRDAAFAACRYIIDEVKRRVPIWKKEYYLDGDSGWVECEHCAGTHDKDSCHGGPFPDKQGRNAG